MRGYKSGDQEWRKVEVLLRSSKLLKDVQECLSINETESGSVSHRRDRVLRMTSETKILISKTDESVQKPVKKPDTRERYDSTHFCADRSLFSYTVLLG